MSPPLSSSSRTPPPAKSDSWEEWAKHVLHELERLNDCMVALQESISNVRIDIATQKVKVGWLSGFYGVAGGVIPVIIMIIVELIINKKI